jgi:hydrogenase maturation protease
MSEDVDPRVTLFVCGEPHRGDDAAAYHAARRLPVSARQRVRVFPVGQLDVQHLLDLPAGAACIVADAVAGLAPGSIWRERLENVADLARGAAEAGVPRARSTHQLPLEQTLSLASLLRGAPLTGSFVGLGGAGFALGTGLSPAVATAIPAFVSAIAAEAEALDAAAAAERVA